MFKESRRCEIVLDCEEGVDIQKEGKYRLFWVLRVYLSFVVMNYSVKQQIIIVIFVMFSIRVERFLVVFIKYDVVCWVEREIFYQVKEVFDYLYFIEGFLKK